jgi:hypothetical protein
MEPMTNGSGDNLDALFAEYRRACPDPEGGANFLPQLWQRIESQRKATAFLFRRWAEVCILATLAASLLITTFLMPRYQREPVYQATYVDVLSAADSNEDFLALPGGGTR